MSAIPTFTDEAFDALPGLRERKKYLSYRTIQEAGVSLIEQQGLAQTSVEQIAALAGVSPRTVYRYFRTKEGLLFSTWTLHEIPRLFAEQPRELGPIGALERALTSLSDGLSEPADLQRRRLRLTLMELPAVNRFAAEAADALALELRVAALEWLDGEPNAAAIADILAALLRMAIRSHFDGVPLEDKPLSPWVGAMRFMLDAQPTG